MRILLCYEYVIAPQGGGSVHGNQLVDQLRRLGHEIHSTRTPEDERTIHRSASVRAMPELLRDVDVIYMRCRPKVAWDMTLVALNRRTTRRPLVLELNAPPDEAPPVRGLKRYLPVAGLRKRWRSGVYDWMLHQASAVICVSSELAEDVRQRFGLPTEKVHAVPNGGGLPKDIDETALKDIASRETDRPFRVVWLGSWTWPMQAFDDVVAGLNGFLRCRPDAEAHIYTHNAKPSRSDHPQLHYHPTVRHDEVPALLRTMDVGLCMRSPQGWYASPLKLFDYMSAGLVVVASNIGQIPEVIADGVSGRLVPVGDRDAITEALLELADQAPAARQAMGEAAARRIADSYSWDHTGDRIETVLQGLAERRRQAR